MALEISVLDLSESAGAGFAASLFADHGARVYLVERPPDGANLRRSGPPELGDDWWDIVGRNKRSFAFDPAHPEAAPVMMRLLTRVDVVITDIGRPRWAADPWLRLLDQISASPPLVLDLFPTGADRPDLWFWDTASVFAGAVSGMAALTGYETGPPVQPEMPLAEYLGGVLAAAGALAELRAARLRNTAPADFPVAMHEAVQRAIEWQVPIATAFGRPEPRIGNRFPLSAGVSNMHRTGDGKYLAVSAATQAVASRLIRMIGDDTLARDERFASPQARANNMDALYRVIDGWIDERSADEVLAAAEDADVVIGRIYSVDDILVDPQISVRGNIVYSDRQVPMPAPLPLVGGVAPVIGAAPRIGEHSMEVLKLAGLGADEIVRLAASRVIWTPMDEMPT